MGEHCDCLKRTDCFINFALGMRVREIQRSSIRTRRSVKKKKMRALKNSICVLVVYVRHPGASFISSKREKISVRGTGALSTRMFGARMKLCVLWKLMAPDGRQFSFITLGPYCSRCFHEQLLTQVFLARGLKLLFPRFLRLGVDLIARRVLQIAILIDLNLTRSNLLQPRPHRIQLRISRILNLLIHLVPARRVHQRIRPLAKRLHHFLLFRPAFVNVVEDLFNTRRRSLIQRVPNRLQELHAVQPHLQRVLRSRRDSDHIQSACCDAFQQSRPPRSTHSTVFEVRKPRGRCGRRVHGHNRNHALARLNHVVRARVVAERALRVFRATNGLFDCVSFKQQRHVSTKSGVLRLACGEDDGERVVPVVLDDDRRGMRKTFITTQRAITLLKRRRRKRRERVLAVAHERDDRHRLMNHARGLLTHAAASVSARRHQARR
mmetsp:Transcript_6679/g.14280  ORF Transcript_6679/g.14280 Transcript_6679/m.14280 type:complete len:437 (+) Transcript_6679:88-1398(+)